MLPHVAEMDENSTNSSRSSPAVASSRCTAPSAFAPSAADRPSRSVSSTRARNGRFAECSTVDRPGPDSSSQATIPVTCSRAPRSQLTTSTSDPAFATEAANAATPSADGPERDVSTTRGAPRSASQTPTLTPIEPVPPVSSTVPRGVQPAASVRRASACTRRRRNTPEGRSATWSSRPSASTAANRAAVCASNSAGRSTRPPQNSGRSSPTARPRPHTCAWTGLVVTSPAPVCTAPRVSTHNGTDAPASFSSLTRSTVAAVPRGTHG